MIHAREIRKKYHDLLKDYRWKEFSDTTIENSGSVCWACDTSDNLQVHHLIYRDVMPWQYSQNEVRVLCKECHEAIHLVADLVWVATLRFEPHQLEILLKRLRGAKTSRKYDMTTRSESNLGELVRGLCGANSDEFES